MIGLRHWQNKTISKENVTIFCDTQWVLAYWVSGPSTCWLTLEFATKPAAEAKRPLRAIRCARFKPKRQFLQQFAVAAARTTSLLI